MKKSKKENNRRYRTLAALVAYVLIAGLLAAGALLFLAGDDQTQKQVTPAESVSERPEPAVVQPPDAPLQPETQQPVAEPNIEEDNKPTAPQELSGEELNRLFDEADLPNLIDISESDPPAITGQAETDARIRRIAEQRGYSRRPEPKDTSQLVAPENNWHILQPQAAAAYLELKSAAAAAGHHIHITSAFRSYDNQSRIFLNKVGEPYADDDVDKVLRLISIPGYSKHHTGYAIDIGEGALTFQDFHKSGSYNWLSSNNYANAKKYGWLPSYPPGDHNQGPEPEPWEFVYVGKDALGENLAGADN